MDLLHYWGLGVAALVVVVAAVCQLTIRRVPNALTLSALAAAWVVAAMLSAGVAAPSSGGGLAASLLATLATLLGALPFYRNLGLGAGCIKAQMAFAAWVGCCLPWRDALVVSIVGVGIAMALTSLGVYVWRTTKEHAVVFPAQVTFSIGALVGIGYHFATAAIGG